MNFLCLLNITSSNTPPNIRALLPGVVTRDIPHRPTGFTPLCFWAIHFHLVGAVSSLLLAISREYSAELLPLHHTLVENNALFSMRNWKPSNDFKIMIKMYATVTDSRFLVGSPPH